MKFSSVVFLLLFLSSLGNAHNVKLLKSQSSDLDSTGLDASFNNEANIADEDSFFEGTIGILKTKNSYDSSESETKNYGFQAITPDFITFGLVGSVYDNTSEELRTRTTGLEVGKKFLFGKEDASGFRTFFGFKIKGERVTLEQSKTFLRRKFDFGLEQSATGFSLSYGPASWFEVSGSYTKNKYNNDMETVKARLNQGTFLASFFSNLQNTLNSLSDTSKTLTLRLIPDSEFDISISRTFSDDLLTDTQYNVGTVDLGIYYFSRVYFFMTAGETYSSATSSKSTFTELSLQINF